MNRKELSEKFNIIGENKNLSLYRKNGEYKYGFNYCGNITLKNGKAYFNNVGYATIDELDNALLVWEKSLPYPVETYCPMLREAYRIESRIIWYLTEKLGFEHDTTDWGRKYTRKIGDSFALVFEIDYGKADNDTIALSSRYGGLYFAQTVDNAETAIAIIDTIVNSETLCLAKDIVDIILCCGEKVTSEIDAFIPDENSIFGLKKMSFKDLMIEKLETVLNGLKH